MPKKSTREEVIEEFVKTHGDNYGYSEFTDYENNKQKIEIFCKKHNSYFSQVISSHKRGIGCPKCGVEKCSNAITKTTEQFIEEAQEVHGDTYAYTQTVYIKGKEKVEILCKEHGIFKQTPHDHLGGHGCDKCGTDRMADSKRKSLEQFISEANVVHNNTYTYENVNYISSTNRVNITCRTHGDFSQLPYNHLIGYGCPKCFSSVSKAEQEIANFILTQTEIEQSNRDILSGKELDIYIPSIKTAIEFNGLYWHSDKFVEDTYHLDKLNRCNEKGIRLIQIFEDEWRDKQEIVKSRLLNLIEKTPNKVFARKCEIREVGSKESMKFLNDNHIQGKLGAKVRIGLYHNNELVSLMTFGGLRKSLGQNSKEGHYELLRFCNKINTNVVGGASKLHSYFEKEYTPTEVISYADLRWSEGNLYNKLEYNLVHKSKPNYFYTKGIDRQNRFIFRKSELVKQGYDNKQTEKQIMEQLGFSRIYDSGTLKFSKTWLKPQN